MGIFDRFRRSAKTEGGIVTAEAEKRQKVFVGAGAADSDEFVQVYDNSNITYSGELADYDYTSILRNKQDNIVDLFQLADYYCDADPICHGIVYHVFVPFGNSSPWYLTGDNEKTLRIYEDYYKRIRISEVFDDIFTHLAKYNNCVLYVLDGNIITLPIHKCRISNTMLNRQPLVELDVQSIQTEWKMKGYTVQQDWIKDNELEYAFKGYPPEVQTALNAGAQYAQMNPENTFVIQGPHEGWMRWAVPWIAAALPALSRKELIREYEVAMLNLKRKSIFHVRYGDEKKGADILPDREQLVAVRSLFRQGMNGFPLVVTNQLAKAEILSADLSDLYQWPIYSTVNEEILSAGGISGILVTGTSDEGSTFSTAQVSTQMAEARINAMREEICDIMNRINARMTEWIEGTYNLKETPKFHFAPLDMSGKKALREACNDLWTKGVVSTKTMMENNGYSMELERKQREKESSEGIDETFMPREMKYQQAAAAKAESQEPAEGAPANGRHAGGRPKKSDSERTSSPDKAASGAQPKPSNPEGSESG